MKELLWTPIFAWPLIVLLAVIVAGAVAWSVWRALHSHSRAFTSGALRIGGLLVLALILMQPQRRFDEVTILKPQLAVLVDTSESMSDPVDESQPRRAERVKQWLASPVVATARKDFDVRMFTFDSKLGELPAADATNLKFQGNGSALFTAVNQMQERFRGQPLAGVLLLSDGLDTSGLARNISTLTVLPLSQGVPVFTFELEKPFQRKEKGKRIALGNVDYPARVVVGWEQEIKAGIVGSGMSGSTVRVELWREGKKDKETTVAFNEDEQTRPVAFPIAPEKPGMIQYELRVADAAADNDARKYPFVIEALAPGKRILYLQNSLGFDFKFLRKAMVSDRNLQLSAFVRWGDGRIVSMSERGIPAEAKLDFTTGGLGKYSVVILGDLAPEALTGENYQQLKEFVNRGGGLVLLGGPNQLAGAEIGKTALGELSPVNLPAEYREGATLVTIAEAGLRHPVFGPLFSNIKDFPPLLTANLSSGVAPTAEVLMEANVAGKTVPLIASTRFGQGRVVAIMTDTIWRWRLGAKSWGGERSPYDTFWTQLMDWLIPKEQEKQSGHRLELFTERSNYLLGERPEVRAVLSLDEERRQRLPPPPNTSAPPTTAASLGGKDISQSRPPTLPLTVRTPDGKTFEYTMKAAMLPASGSKGGARESGQQTPGYRIETEPNVPGVFAAASTVTIAGTKIDAETRFVVTKPMTEHTAKPIHRELLQRIAEQTGGKYFAFEERDNWPAHIHCKQQQFSRMQISDLWNHPALLSLFFGLLATDWICRKRWNLP